MGINQKQPNTGQKKGPRSGWLRGPDVARAGRATFRPLKPTSFVTDEMPDGLARCCEPVRPAHRLHHEIVPLDMIRAV